MNRSRIIQLVVLIALFLVSSFVMLSLRSDDTYETGPATQYGQ